jgi:hypothetical protein
MEYAGLFVISAATPEDVERIATPPRQSALAQKQNMARSAPPSVPAGQVRRNNQAWGQPAGGTGFSVLR